MTIHTLAVGGSAAHVESVPNEEFRTGRRRIVEDRHGGGWYAAQLYMRGPLGRMGDDAFLTARDLRHLAGLADRLADWLDDKPHRCACDRPRFLRGDTLTRGHSLEPDGLCPAMADDPARPYCAACWSPEYGMTQHDRDDDRLGEQHDAMAARLAARG